MNNISRNLLILSILIFTFSVSYSQSETDTLKTSGKVVVKMNNGDEYTGNIIKQDSKVIVLKTENGEINLISSNVKTIEDYTYVGKYRFANPHDTRYFFGPTAIPIKKKKGYYQNVLLTTNFINYGIHENFSIGGGFEFFTTIFGQPIWFLTPKAGFKIQENLYVGGGFIMAGFAAEGTATLAYGAITLGSSETNVSFGAGYGLAGGEMTNYPALMFSGTHRVSNNVAILSENYFIPGDSESIYFGIHGFRILAKDNAFDIGLIIIPQVFEFIPALPFIGYSRAF